MAAKKSGSKKSHDKLGSGLMIGAGLAAAATAGYLLFGPKGKENRKKIKAWTVKAKGEILEKMEKMEHIGHDKYEEIVDKVAAKYAKMKDIDQADIEKFVKEAKKHWKSVEKDLKPKVKKAVSKAKSAAKKTASKAKKKAPAKKKTTTKKK
jgi:gas vesicle protein